MDEITESVRELYESYPYPAGNPVQRLNSDVRLLMNYSKLSRDSGTKPIQVLDAGCGRGIGLIGCATLQPDVQFTGIDINRVALEELRESVKLRNLNNIQIQEVDLMTLEGLEVPEGGFDVIYSSGVLHHLSDPVQGLKKLKSVLAPHGIIALMLYSTHGRQPLYRLINARKLLVPDGSVEQQLPLTRELAEFCSNTVLNSTPWDSIAKHTDVEFVDISLNPNETSYSVDSLWELLSETNMRFLRWSNPEHWSINVLPEGNLRDAAAKLDTYSLYRLLEQVSWITRMELIITHEENESRETFNSNSKDDYAYAVNPEVSFIIEHKNHRTGKRRESLLYKKPTSETPTVCTDIAQLIALSILSEQTEAFTAEAFLTVMAEDGISREAAIEVLDYFLDEEVIYRPHITDI